MPASLPSAPLRLIPDINVLLSGFTSAKGPARELYVAAQRFEVQFILAEEHMEELSRVLTYPVVLNLGGASLHRMLSALQLTCTA